MMEASYGLLGRRFERLVVIGVGCGKNGSWTRKSRSRFVVCECDCGALLEALQDNLLRGRTMSCGCLRREREHGWSRTPTYVSWAGAIQRTTNPSDPYFADYGGRGIRVCERWRDFRHFLADMGERPPGTTLDRWPNVDGNYEPGNCRWATAKEQMNNRRNSRMIAYKGVTLTVTEWAERTGINRTTIQYRLNKDWPAEKVLGFE